MNNPWLGLSSYTEESIKEYQFNGRSTAIAALTTFIRQNLFVTLYGRSGIGKTSLLQAGVYPILRRDGYSPLTIRLNELKDGEDNAAKNVWESITSSLFQNGYQYKFCDEKDKYIPDFTDILVFRKLFSAGRFLNKNGDEAVPVIVLDQFEEILYNAPLSSRLLTSQLYALIDDNYNLGVSHPYWHDDTNFRIVISIREDDLFLFEDNIDSLNCVDFKSNRYRLLPLSESEAKEVILNPVADKHIFEEGNENAIATEIINLTKGNGQNINTLLLSLICYVLYEDCAKQGKRITTSALANYNDIIETYYKEVTMGLPKEQRYYIEDHLIDNQGRRTSVYLSDLEKNAPKAKHLIGNSNHRILNENQGRVELIHDQLAVSIMKLRNNRKSRKTKQIGVTVLIILLAGVFFFSFSRFPAYNTHGNSLINNTEVSHVSIKMDSGDYRRYTINDCPFLKSIKIESQTSVNVYNCPSLVSISYPEEYSGHVYVRNCPNVNMEDDRIVEESISVLGISYEEYQTAYKKYQSDSIPYRVYQSDSTRYEFYKRDSLGYEKYKSQFPHGSRIHSECLPGIKEKRDAHFNYDSISKSVIVNKSPGYHFYSVSSEIQKGYHKLATHLTDSIKRITDCYVPYGYGKVFSLLVEYQPFHSIKELPRCHTWRENAVTMFEYFKSDENKTWLVLTYIGLLIVQCFFWITSFCAYKSHNKNILTAIARSFIYGIGMSLIATLSFMSFYWTFYNIISPDQPIATLLGVIGCVLCMGLIYRNSFYSLSRYVKENGIKGLFKSIIRTIMDLPKQIKYGTKKIIEKCVNIPNLVRKNLRATIAIIVLIALSLVVSYAYMNGKEKREFYLHQLNEILDSGEYARAYAIIQEANNQHKSWGFPSFSDSLQSIEDKLIGDSIYLIHRITPSYLYNLAAKNNAPLNISRFRKIMSISEDGSNIVICVKYDKSNDLQKDSIQAIYLDLNDNSVKVLTPKSTASNYYFNSSFSPTGNSLIVSDNANIYLYVPSSKALEVISGYAYDINGLLMENDSIYYFTKNTNLYMANVNYGSRVLLNESEDIYDDLHLISPHLIWATGKWDEIIIYNTLEDSVYFHSKYKWIGGLRSINQDYAITTSGLFDIKKDSLIKMNPHLYNFKGQTVELQKHGNQYSLHDLKGVEIVKITTKNDEYVSDTHISRDGSSIINYSSDCISIYSVTPIADRNWIISESDKKTFDLK